MLLRENKQLAPLTTFGIGGPARWFIEAHSEGDLVEAVAFAQARGLPIFVLGGGSNLLVADAGFDGVVLHICLRGVEIQEEGDEIVLFRACAGEDWDALVQRAVEGNCAGLECLAGIPGTVGGTPVQNVGAYGQEVASVIDRVRVLDLETGEFRRLAAAECGFAYRRSRFNGVDRGRFIVSSVDFRLLRHGEPNLAYADLQRAFPPPYRPTIVEVAAEVRRIRQTKGMLLVENDPDCRSAGSFFKNPVVPVAQLSAIAAAAASEPPHFPSDSAERVKVPAAWLIERAGFRKGDRRGAAGVSSRHTLALVNGGGATATDIMALAREIESAVEDRFGVSLEREPVLLGF